MMNLNLTFLALILTWTVQSSCLNAQTVVRTENAGVSNTLGLSDVAPAHEPSPALPEQSFTTHNFTEAQGIPNGVIYNQQRAHSQSFGFGSVVQSQPIGTNSGIQSDTATFRRAVGPLGGNFEFGVLHVHLHQNAIVSYNNVPLRSLNDHRLHRTYRVANPSSTGSMLTILAQPIAKDGTLSRQSSAKQVMVYPGQQSELHFHAKDFEKRKIDESEIPITDLAILGVDTNRKKQGKWSNSIDFLVTQTKEAAQRFAQTASDFFRLNLNFKAESSPSQKGKEIRPLLTWSEMRGQSENKGWDIRFDYGHPEIQYQAVLTNSSRFKFNDKREIKIFAASTEPRKNIEGGDLFFELVTVTADGKEQRRSELNPVYFRHILVDASSGEIRLSSSLSQAIKEDKDNVQIDKEELQSRLGRAINEVIRSGIGDPKTYQVLSNNGTSKVFLVVQGFIAKRNKESDNQISRYPIQKPLVIDVAYEK